MKAVETGAHHSAPADPGAVVEAPSSVVAARLTVRDVARRYRVGPDKVRGWINRGLLRAINTADKLCRRPRWVVLPESLAEFERQRTSGPPPEPLRRRRRRTMVDYYAE